MCTLSTGMGSPAHGEARNISVVPILGRRPCSKRTNASQQKETRRETHDMSRTGWKQIERNAAALIGAKRHWANAGEREDADSPYFAAQVKNTKQLPLEHLTCLVEEMTMRGIDAGKIPI